MSPLPKCIATTDIYQFLTVLSQLIMSSASFRVEQPSWGFNLLLEGCLQRQQTILCPYLMWRLKFAGSSYRLVVNFALILISLVLFFPWKQLSFLEKGSYSWSFLCFAWMHWHLVCTLQAHILYVLLQY